MTNNFFGFQQASRVAALSALALSLLVLMSAADAQTDDCGGDTEVDGTETSTQNITSNLCSYTVTSDGKIELGGPDPIGINNKRSEVITLTNDGEINLNKAIFSGRGILNSAESTIVTLTNTKDGKISTTSSSGNGIYNLGVISTLNNSGTISAGDSGSAVRNSNGEITLLDNSGTISAGGFGKAIDNAVGEIGRLDNSDSGTISAGDSGYAIYNAFDGKIDRLDNSGTISAGVGGRAIINFKSKIDHLDNTGSINAGNSRGRGVENFDGSTITTLTNSGTITAGNSGKGVYNRAGSTITNFNNSGTITTEDEGIGIYNAAFGGDPGTITTLTNSGKITAVGSSIGVRNRDGSTITTFNNTGVISAGAGGYGIRNEPDSTITTLNNQQGQADGALKYQGKLPENYNIIIQSPTDYGQVSFFNASGELTFGIDESSTLETMTYEAVIAGLDAEKITATSGAFQSGDWELVNSSGKIWDLTVSGFELADIVAGNAATLGEVESGTVNPVFDGGTLALSTGEASDADLSVEAGGGTITAPASGSATLSGVISGEGGLTFNGSGTTILTGTNSYSGGTTVSSGTLSVAGQSPTGTGDVFIASGATLEGRGRIIGRVTVSGTLNPGNSPGYLETNATVTMNAGSTYLQDIAGTTQASSSSPVGATGYYSFLDITSGQFVIRPGATLEPRLAGLFTPDQSGFGSAIFVPQLGDQFRVVTAEGGISGKFAAVKQPEELAPGTQFMPFYNMAGSNSLDLAIIPSVYEATIADASGNLNAQSVGVALTQIAQAGLVGNATPAQDQLLYAIAGQPSGQQIANFAQRLAGEVYAANLAVTAQTTQRTQQTVLHRLGDTAGFDTLAERFNAEAAQAPSTSNNAWGSIDYQRGDRSGDNHSGGWSSDLFQLTLGSDLYVADETTLGAGFSVSNITLNADYSGSSTVQQGGVFAYGKTLIDAFTLDAMASVGLSSSDISRDDITGLSTGFRDKRVSGNDALVSVGLSRVFNAEHVRLTPYARLTWQHVEQSSIDEGTAASSLSVNRHSADGISGVLGLATGSKVSDAMAAKVTYRAYAGLGADSSALVNPSLDASLVGLNTTITTPDAGTTFLQAGAYGTVKFAKLALIYAGISGEARSEQTLSSINVGMTGRF